MAIIWLRVALVFYGLGLVYVLVALTRTKELLNRLSLHAAYLGTAIMEGAHDRYIMPTWPLLGSAPILALGLTFRRRSLPVSGPTMS